MRNNNREREGVGDAQDPEGEPHVIIRGQLLAIPHKISQDFKAPRHAQHSRRHGIRIRQSTAAPPGRGGGPGPPSCGKGIGTNAERTDVSGAIRSGVEHVEGVHALGWAAQNDAGIQCWRECIGYP